MLFCVVGLSTMGVRVPIFDTTEVLAKAGDAGFC
jgi:hypothetical protein